MASALLTDSTDTYRRQARRLRHELRNEPQRLHHSLQAIAQWQNLTAPKPLVWRQETRQDHVKNLIAGVAEKMEGSILRYPARIELLKQAQRDGLPQFDANLIITAAQHRLGERITPVPRQSHPWLRNLLIALIFQAWILAGLYWLLA